MDQRLVDALSSLWSILWPPLLLFGVVLGGWQAYVQATDVPTVILPSPVDVATAAAASSSTLLDTAIVTAVTASVGLLAGATVGIAIAFAMLGSRAIAAVAHPYLIAFRITPLIAIAPLVFLWFGSALLARAMLVATLTTFPVAIASFDGLRSTSPVYTDLGRSVDASAHDIFLRIHVPAAAPSVFAGLKLAAALSVIGTVVAEFLTLRAGLGYQIFKNSIALETAGMFAAVFALVGLGLLFYSVPVLAERAISWTDSEQATRR
ncbi:MAG: putative hydroxymethylpyrimidine transport system permease protein [Haloarculaceae archaeon]|jgi:putative hydroxymethylpyrimidine transport system permease protein